MSYVPANLPVVALRLAGHIGQTALDRIADGGVAAVAELDQHIAAVRAELAACQQRLPSAAVACPDVPFVGDALEAEATVPVALLLHYAFGFVDAALSSGWQPADSADATDWASVRLAAICQLIIQAQAAADLHPDLRAWAE
jgi:Family of unknown function (DUF6401)